MGDSEKHSIKTHTSLHAAVNRDVGVHVVVHCQTQDSSGALNKTKARVKGSERDESQGQRSSDATRINKHGMR